MIPDWSWTGAFSINNWDVTDADVSVMYVPQGGEISLYNSGKLEGKIEKGQIPGFATVIVKNNERMKIVSPATKGQDAVYDFIDEEFDGRKSIPTKRDHEYSDKYFNVDTCCNFVPASEIDTINANAFNMFHNHVSASERDYSYYGMTDTLSRGKKNTHITEYIDKICLGSANCEYLYDDAGNDFDKVTSYTRYIAIPDSVLVSAFMYEGNLELYFDIEIQNNDGSSLQLRKLKTAGFSDLFQLSKVHVDFMHKTWFQERKWVYTVDANCYVPKWFDVNIELPDWDINAQSTVINIKVTEGDSSATIETNDSVQYSKTTNFTSEANVSGKIGNAGASGTGAVKISYGVTDKHETTKIIKVTRTEKSDDLGTGLLYYYKPILLSQGNLLGVDGYFVKTIDTGYVSMIILPRYE